MNNCPIDVIAKTCLTNLGIAEPTKATVIKFDKELIEKAISQQAIVKVNGNCVTVTGYSEDNGKLTIHGCPYANFDQYVQSFQDKGVSNTHGIVWCNLGHSNTPETQGEPYFNLGRYEHFKSKGSTKLATLRVLFAIAIYNGGVAEFPMLELNGGAYGLKCEFNFVDCLVEIPYSAIVEWNSELASEE